MAAYPSGRTGGFTLVELMITVAIAAILASIAIPSYRSYVLRSRRVDATTALMRIQAAQEKFFLQCNTYAPNLTSAPPAGLGMSASSENAYYDLVLTPDAADPMRFIASATPRGSQAKDRKCQRFSIDQSGVRRAEDDARDDRTGECWR